jgi:hypothetical protein
MTQMNRNPKLAEQCSLENQIISAFEFIFDGEKKFVNKARAEGERNAKGFLVSVTSIGVGNKHEMKLLLIGKMLVLELLEKRRLGNDIRQRCPVQIRLLDGLWGG